MLYKLVPIAGVLSMLLSLGGNIVPTAASGYKVKVPRFSYGGLMRTRSNDADIEDPDEFLEKDESDSQIFANMVEQRAKHPRGGQRFFGVWCGIAFQVFWIGVVMVACWFVGSGSILFWYCKVCNIFRYACHRRRHYLLTSVLGLGLDVALVSHCRGILDL